MDSNWSRSTLEFENPNHSSQFMEYVGLTRKAKAAKSPADFFSLFFTKKMFASVAEQTSLYQK